MGNRSNRKTGRTRHRIETRLLRKPLLVLQYEWRTTGYYVDMYGDGQDYDYCYWKDAEVGDVTENVNEND